MVAEAEHKKGEEGVLTIKRWLESTTYVTINFTVYDDQVQTTATRLDGEVKRYDLAGHFLGENRRPLLVEVKNYTVVGKQPDEYPQFLANAYSITAAAIAAGVDKKTEFMWVTWHPFSQNKWAHLTSEKEVKAAVEANPEVLADHELDPDIVRLVAQRLWLAMLNRRQEELLLSRSELFQIHGVLQRKGMM
ncbi:MAG TPA: hypothetical protein VHX38_31745 [Pseudonocardiaceae bacterium]|jgi:hypothetical protein|nr:hypothetical protein [Pseudonocardiaceae bacterium]